MYGQAEAATGTGLILQMRRVGARAMRAKVRAAAAIEVKAWRKAAMAVKMAAARAAKAAKAAKIIYSYHGLLILPIQLFEIHSILMALNHPVTKGIK